ncbi:MAG TPA: COX15/CtaA family protein [Kofleriaceae bacterium]|jgi:heme A synthase
MLEHRIAKLAAGAVFILLVIGGMVNPTGSSLACPEPTMVCHGALFPPMVGGVFYEHGHRLAAMTVGLLQIALTILLVTRRNDLKRVSLALLGLELLGVVLLAYDFKLGILSAGALSLATAYFTVLVVVAFKKHLPFVGLGLLLLDLVIAQGTLGALTVKFKLPWFVSTGHLLLGMSYFATLIYTAFRTRPEPTAAELARHAALRSELGAARTWITIACSAVFVQILLGALVRHLGAAMVCLGMPSCTRSGEWWPDAGVQQLHMIHRGFGVVVAIVTTIAAVKVFRHARNWPALRKLAMVAPILVAAQVALGIITVLTLRSVPVAVGHFAGAASLWALWMSAWLMTRERHAAAAADEELVAA